MLDLNLKTTSLRFRKKHDFNRYKKQKYESIINDPKTVASV